MPVSQRLMLYGRYYLEGGSYFLTINLTDRSSRLLVQEIDTLRFAFKTVKQKHPFDIDAIIILSDHIHMLCTLPEGDIDYSKRIKLIKYYFSYYIAKTERISFSRRKKKERGIWQRRFWEDCILDEADYRTHIEYIHMNPIKHGYVK